jgi:hypothetical protein
MSASGFWEQVENGMLIESCPIRLADIMPCHDPKRAKLFSKERNYYRERHCPSFEEKLRCLIPPPSDYQIPVRWPESLQKVSFPLLCFVFFFCIQVSSHCAHSLWGEEEGVKLIFIKKKLNLWIIFFSHLSCQIWFNNTPHAKIATLKSDQGWMVQEGDYFVFPGGGTSFPEGADGYIEKLGKFIPFGTNSVRTVLDIGCGVQSYHALHD